MARMVIERLDRLASLGGAWLRTIARLYLPCMTTGVRKIYAIARTIGSIEVTEPALPQPTVSRKRTR